jgi:glycosyltransferase involved in cell wall biosynthesis
VYAGGTSGWYEFLERERSSSFLKEAYQIWKEAGRYEMVDLDHRTHGPVFVGRAVKRLVEQHPDWAGRIHVDVYGKRYPETVENAVLDKFDIQDIVHLHGPVSHDEALRRMAEADLLFMALPDRLDGSPGGRISAKTYEYLRTDRPILAGLPPGENREYLRDKPGVHVTPPDGIGDMADVIECLATASFNGRSIAVDRSELHSSLSSTARAQKFEQIVARTAYELTTPSASSSPRSAD